MITKKRLLSGLEELLYVEEEVVTMYANFSKVLVKQTEGLKENDKDQLRKLISVLYHDSSRHKEAVNKLIDQIGKSARDEY